MRFFITASLGVALFLVFGLGSGCTAGVLVAGSEGGSDAPSEGALFDTTQRDVVTVVFDSGGSCTLMGSTYDKTCATASDCTTVARGCYCGAQPIIGVAKTAQPAAQTCESQAEKSCALGCANAPGHVGEDGQNDEGTGRNLEVLCDAGKCHTALMP